MGDTRGNKPSSLGILSIASLVTMEEELQKAPSKDFKETEHLKWTIYCSASGTVWDGQCATYWSSPMVIV